jgi:hypothetical protein
MGRTEKTLSSTRLSLVQAPIKNTSQSYRQIVYATGTRKPYLCADLLSPSTTGNGGTPRVYGLAW